MKSVSSLLACAGTAGALVLGALVFPPAGRPASAAVPPVVAISTLLPAQGGQYGTIKGRLVWGGGEIPTPPAKKADKDPEVCGKVQHTSRDLIIDPQNKGIKDWFAYLPRPVGKNAEAEKALLDKTPKVEIDQKNCEYTPFSTAIHKNQEILFKSSDPVGHNVHYTGFQNNANFALSAKGEASKKLAKDAVPVTLKCDIHPWMSGWIMVFDHPFFALTKEDGSFEITGVPAGTQNLVIRSGKVGYVTPGAGKGMAVQVKAGMTTDVGEIKVPDAAAKKAFQ